MWRRSLYGAIGARGAGAAAFDPLSLSPTAWYDPSDLNTLFQDSAATTPVTSDGDVVGYIGDKSGNGNHLLQATTANKPLYKTSGGLHWIEGDGTDDWIQAVFTLNQPFDRISAIQQITWTNGDNIFGGVTATGNFGQTPSTPNVVMYGGAQLALNNDPALGTSAVITERFNGASSRGAVNNNAYASGNAGADNPGGFTMFAYGNPPASGFAQAKCFGVFIRAAGNLTDGQITSLRTYYAEKSGVTL